MTRLQRIAPLGIPQHIIQRGNNRQVCFVCDQDIAFYASLLHEYSKKIYRLVTCLGVYDESCSPVGKSVYARWHLEYDAVCGKALRRYFYREYRRSGTLWEGRFKSSLVQSETYLLQCQRYIELNPVRNKHRHPYIKKD